MPIESDYPLSGYADTLIRSTEARLNQHYPAFAGHWLITVSEPGGTIMVSNTLLSGRMGFLMHINKIDPEGRKIVRCAGELLERYKISRDRAFDILNMEGMPRTFRGDLVADNG